MISRRATQRTVAGAALALTLPVLAGCGFDSKDETSQERSQVQTADNHIGAIRIRNAFITTLPIPNTGNGTPGASQTYLVVTLVNNGTASDTFTGITTSRGTATFSSGPVTLPPGVVVQVSDPDLDSSAPSLVITGTAPTVGLTTPVPFTFAAAGTSTAIAVPIVNPGRSLAPTQVIPTTQARVGTPIV